MKVRILTLAAGPLWVRRPGDIVDVPESEAQELIAGHYAVAISEAATPVVETTEAGPSERAVKRGPGRPPKIR